MYVTDALGQPLTSGFQLPLEFLPANIYYHSPTTLLFLMGNGVSWPHCLLCPQSLISCSTKHCCTGGKPEGYHVGGSNYHVCVLPHLCRSRSGLLLMEVAHFRSSSPSHLGKQWPNLHLVLRLLHFSQTLEEYSMAGRGPHGLHSWTDFLCPRIQQSLCLTLQEYWIHWSPVIRHVLLSVHAVSCQVAP